MRLDEQGLPEGYPFREGLEVTPRELAELRRGGGGLLLVDCRTERERDAALIEGSLFIPLGELAHRVDELEEIDQEKVVVYCHHGIRSMQAVSLLRAQGIGGAVSLAGGIDLWSVAIDPSVPRY